MRKRLEIQKREDSWVKVKIRVKNIKKMKPFLPLIYQLIRRENNCTDKGEKQEYRRSESQGAANRGGREHKQEKNSKSLTVE